MTDIDVLIVGAGPVGLALACDLAWRGVPSTLVERGDGSIYQPKMDLVGIRTMEHCRRWGIVQDVIDSPYPRDYPQDNAYVTALNGYELGRERVPAMAAAVPPPQSPQIRERCPQDMFDPILRRFATSFDNVTLRYHTELVNLVEHPDHVEVTLRDVGGTGTERRCTARYVVGCDGASSAVRNLAGIRMSGTPALTYTTNIIFRCRDLPDRHDKAKAYRFIFIGPEGTWATIVAINGADRWRMSLIGDATPRVWSTPEIHEAILRAVGVPIDYEIETVVPWTRGELVADRYGTERVFVAGDAAHVMSPTGGFGMNTGIGDAVDLSWKLAATLDGWGTPGLLASYEHDRRPIAQRNVAEASRNLGRMLSPRNELRPPPEFLEPGDAGERARRYVGQGFAAQMKHEWHTLGIHLGYRYASPVFVPDGSPEPPDEKMTYTQTTYPGARAPHVWLGDGRSTLDLFGRGFVLLRLGTDAATDTEGTTGVDTGSFEAAAATRRVPLSVVTLDTPDVVAAYETRYVLVRPDGHVAWRADMPPADPGGVLDTVRGAYSGRRSAPPAQEAPTREVPV